MIALRDVTKHFQEGERRHTVLRELNLEIQSGEILVILGKSGSGKSTLLNLVSGIDLPTSGEICIRETLINDLPDESRTLFRRKHIGFIFQFFNLVPTLTVAENLRLPMELNANSPGEGYRERILHYLSLVGLENRESSYPDRLSGGEQQRIAIARAIIHEPDLILADEPTGNLDYDIGQQVLNLLDRMVREHHKTLIMVTHSREVIGLADRVYQLKGGELHFKPDLPE